MKNSLKFVLCALLTFAFTVSPPDANAGKKNSPVNPVIDQQNAEFNSVYIQNESKLIEIACYANILAYEANYLAFDVNCEAITPTQDAIIIDFAIIYPVAPNLSDQSLGYAEKSLASWQPQKHVIYLNRYSGGFYSPPRQV